jgi:tetratricopeptide (TPR) repeat protein
VSPDGKTLAIWSRTSEARLPRFELLLIDLATLKVTTGPGTLHPEAICWSGDGKYLVYGRGIEPPLPPDCLQPPLLERADGLFLWDIEKKAETRLSRGAGFFSPSLSRDGTLFFLAWQQPNDQDHLVLRLRRTPLDALRKFAEQTPVLPLRDVPAWTALVDKIFQELELPAEPLKKPPSLEQLAKVVQVFAREYQQRFREKPPAEPEEFDRQIQEVRGLAFPADARRRLMFILAAIRGEYLRNQHGAVWHFTDPGPPGDGSAVDNPFALAVDFFHPGADSRPLPEKIDERDAPMMFLRALVARAQGRTLVLTNNPSAAQETVRKLIDDDYLRITPLLKEGKLDEAEQLVMQMLDRPVHRGNDYLVLLAGGWLYDHRRLATLEKLMDRHCKDGPPEARKFNLLGMALLDRDPKAAITAFQKALRCDLRFGPGYLNLAQAYRQANDTPSAIACLRRYLELMPRGELADDAAARLGAWQP